MSQSCFCGSNQPYQSCCQPYHTEKKTPPTPETLLRSRFSAYALKLAPYIQSTMLPPASLQFNEQAITHSQTSYLKLTIINQEIMSPNQEANITFEVTYQNIQENPLIQTFTEKSLFKKVNEKWFYVDAMLIG